MSDKGSVAKKGEDVNEKSLARYTIYLSHYVGSDWPMNIPRIRQMTIDEDIPETAPPQKTLRHFRLRLPGVS